MANAIPGVSGGTIAVVLGIYDRLIGGISRFFTDVKGNLKFLLLIGAGAGLGIVLLGTLITFCIERFPMATNFFFTGLILGSVPMLYEKAKALGKAKAPHYVCFLVFIALMAVLAFVGESGEVSAPFELTFSSAIFLLISAFVAAVGMLLPGVSGSMLLLMFGAYYPIMNAVSEREILTLLPVGAGVGLGLLLGSMIIDFFLTRLPLITYYAILGMVIGSLIAVVKNAFVTEPSVLAIAASIIALLIGIGISLAFEKWNKRTNPE